MPPLVPYRSITEKLTEEQVTATHALGPDAGCWDDRQAVLMRIVDELCGTGTLTDGTLGQLEEGWTVEEQLEILALCGTYHTVSFVANVARLPAEPFAAAVPPN